MLINGSISTLLSIYKVCNESAIYKNNKQKHNFIVSKPHDIFFFKFQVTSFYYKDSSK